MIRAIHTEEIYLLKDFLYDAIFVPEGELQPDKTIIYKPELKLYIEDFGSNKDDICLVYEDEGNIKGAVWCRIMNDYGHIDNNTPSLALSVKEKYRRQGIGTALVECMLECLRQKGYSQVSLSVQKLNFAVRMYLNLGFEIFSENDNEYIMLEKLEYYSQE